MGDQTVTQTIVVSQDAINEEEIVSKASFFAENGDPVVIGAVVATGANVILTGLTTGTAQAPLATDSVNVAIANLQAQIDALS